MKSSAGLSVVCLLAAVSLSGCSRKGRTLSTQFDDEHFCARLISHNDPAAADNCSVLRIDMGDQYQNTVSRFAELKTQICEEENSNQTQNTDMLKEARLLESKFIQLQEQEFRAAQEARLAVETGKARGLTPEELRKDELAFESAQRRTLRVVTDSLRFKETCR